MPPLLTACCAFNSAYLDKLILALPSHVEVPEALFKICNMNGCVLVLKTFTASEILDNPLLKRYIDLIQTGKITSNHPPTEVHCLNRWFLMKESCMSEGSSLLSFDWDTFITHRFRDSVLQDLSQLDLVMYEWNGVKTNTPIWSICPNLTYASIKALNSYFFYLEKHLDIASIGKYACVGNFSDMQTWSSVYSHIRYLSTGLMASSWDMVVGDCGIAFDHNIHCVNELGIGFVQKTYSLPSGALYTGKKISFNSSAQPCYEVLTLGGVKRKTPLSLHYQGVHAKELFMSSHLNYFAASLCMMDSRYRKLLHELFPSLI